MLKAAKMSTPKISIGLDSFIGHSEIKSSIKKTSSVLIKKNPDYAENDCRMLRLLCEAEQYPP